jgi:hypothetical protein
MTDLPKNVRRGRELLLSTGSSSQQKWLMLKPKKLHIYPRREIAICICPSSGGEMFEYSNWFCTEKLEGIWALRKVLQWNSLSFSYISPRAPDIFQTRPECKLLLWQLLTLLYGAADSFPHDQTDKILTC